MLPAGSGSRRASGSSMVVIWPNEVLFRAIHRIHLRTIGYERSQFMRERRLIALTMVCAAVAAGLLFSTRPISAQNHEHEKGEPPFPIYNPYPPGILPANLESEIARVLREIDVIEARAIQRWHSLPLPTRFPVRPGPNPPVLKDTGTASIETLGELMLFDKNMSAGRNQACTSCHMPYAGWSGPIPSVNLTIIAYPGTVHYRAGKRTGQRHTYAPFFPALQYKQAQGPPVDTQEMGFPDTACVAFRLSQAVYRPLFELMWGKNSLDIKFPPE